MSRPQDKHLIPMTERSEEEAYAIRSAGGKADQGIGWRGITIINAQSAPLPSCRIDSFMILDKTAKND